MGTYLDQELKDALCELVTWIEVGSKLFDRVLSPVTTRAAFEAECGQLMVCVELRKYVRA